jgi:hypothetical protein
MTDPQRTVAIAKALARVEDASDMLDRARKLLGDGLPPPHDSQAAIEEAYRAALVAQLKISNVLKYWLRRTS